MEFTDPIDIDSPWWWVCVSDECDKAMPAPEYNWRYMGIPGEEIEMLRDEDPEGAEAFDTMKRCYLSRLIR